MKTGPDRPIDFEDTVREWLRGRAVVDADEVQALLRHAAEMPRRRHFWSARMLFLAATPVLVVALMSLGLYWQSGRSAASPAPLSQSPVATMSWPPSALVQTPSPVASSRPSLPDPEVWSGDPRLAACGGLHADGTSILTIVELARESDYYQRVPQLGYAAELEVSDPALILVYDGASPASLQVESVTTHLPAPGTYDICIGTARVSHRYQNVSIVWSYLIGTAVPPPRRVLLKLPDQFWDLGGSNLVWDQARGLIWYAYAGCSQASGLYAVDPATGAARQWSIPSNTFGNCDAPQVGLDPTGALWVMENSWLVRVSPENGKVQSVRIAPELTEPSKWSVTSSFPTAIAFDGGDALVARFNTPYLTRVAPDMTVSTLPVPATIAGATGLAVSGGELFALTDAGISVVPLEILSHPPGAAGPSASPPPSAGNLGPNPSLTVRPDGRVVRWSAPGVGVLLAGNGSPDGSVSVPALPLFSPGLCVSQQTGRAEAGSSSATPGRRFSR